MFQDTSPTTLFDQLLAAASSGAAALCADLVARGAPPNGVAPQGQTALVAATANGHAIVVDILLRHGALVNTPETRTVFDRVLYDDRPDILRLLLAADVRERGARETSWRATGLLFAVAARGHEQLLRVLMDFGADPTKKVRPGRQIKWESLETVLRKRGHHQGAALIGAARERWEHDAASAADRAVLRTSAPRFFSSDASSGEESVPHAADGGTARSVGIAPARKM